MPPNCSRCARWCICTWRGKNCCSWHRLSPGAKVADHGRAAQAGGRPEKTESERLHRPSRTLTYLEDTGLFRVSLGKSKAPRILTGGALNFERPSPEYVLQQVRILGWFLKW